MLLKLLLLLLTIDTGEMHSVVATVLSRSRPVSLVRIMKSIRIKQNKRAYEYLEEDTEVVFFDTKGC